MDDDGRHKSLKMILGCCDSTNIRKIHLVLAPQSCSTAARISNTVCTHMCKVNTMIEWHCYILYGYSVWNHDTNYLLLNICLRIYGWLGIWCWSISSSSHIFVFWIVASRWKMAMLNTPNIFQGRHRMPSVNFVCVFECKVKAFFIWGENILYINSYTNLCRCIDVSQRMSMLKSWKWKKTINLETFPISVDLLILAKYHYWNFQVFSYWYHAIECKNWDNNFIVEINQTK